MPGWGTSTDRLRALSAALCAAGVRARPWTYDAVGSIAGLGASLAQAVRGLEAGGERVHLIGHSLGGLMAASAVLDHDAPAASVTTVNSPWRGTWAAYTAHPHDPLGRELRWRAPALGELRTSLGEHLEQDRGPDWFIVSVAADLAAPPSTAIRVPDGERLEKVLVGTHGHSVSLEHPRLVDAIVSRLA